MGISIFPTAGIAGSTGANDNRLLRADGAGGATLQASAITVDDSGNITGAGTYNGVTVGSGLTEFDAEITTYAELVTALASGPKNLLITATLTATQDITLPNTAVRLYGLPGQSIEIAMGVYQFIGGGSSNIAIVENLEISYAYTTTKSPFSGTFARVETNNITIDNNSSGSTCVFAPSGITQIYRGKTFVEPPNIANSRTIHVAGAEALIEDMTITGGGTTTGSSIFFRGKDARIQKLRMTGAFADATTIASIQEGSAAHVAFEITAGTIPILQVIQATIDFLQIETTAIKINHTGTVKSGRLALSEVIFVASAGVEASIRDCEDVGDLDFGAANYGRALNVDCATVSGLTGDQCVLNNVRSAAGYSVGATADGTSIEGGRAGAAGGGGSDTITISSGATDTLVSGTLVDAEISDSGTDSVITRRIY